MYKVNCKRCGKEFGHFGWGICRHLKKVHGIKPSAKDYKFIWKHRLFLCSFPFIALLQCIRVFALFYLVAVPFVISITCRVGELAYANSYFYNSWVHY